MNKVQRLLLGIIVALCLFIFYFKTYPLRDSELISYIRSPLETISEPITHIPVDITLLIVDLKYNEKQGVKICEIQPGSLSVFNGIDYIHDGYGLVPKMFCKFIKHFQTLGWFVFHDISDNKFKDILLEKGWSTEESLETMLQNPFFVSLARTPVKDPHNLADYHGVLWARQWKTMSMEDFRNNFPGIILIDGAVFPYKGDKFKMSHLLTTDERLIKLKPMWNAYPKVFSQELVQQIVQDIPSNILVIKPMKSTRGNGVIIIQKDDLEPTLKYILTEDKVTLDNNPDPSYNHWGHDHCNGFIVEEFIESDPVRAPHLDNNLYDPTMRVVFALIYHQKKMNVVFFEGNWKLPKISLSEPGTLTEKHRSYGHDSNFLSVEPHLLHKIEDQLREPLTVLYQQMLETSH